MDLREHISEARRKAQAIDRAAFDQYSALSKQAAEIEEQSDNASDELNKYIQKHGDKDAIAGVGDELRKDAEYKRLKADYDKSFKALQNINSKLTSFRKIHVEMSKVNRKRQMSGEKMKDIVRTPEKSLSEIEKLVK